ncbi:MAG: hypothetical protein ACOH10_10840 [Rhodoglobus sp.]
MNSSPDAAAIANDGAEVHQVQNALESQVRDLTHLLWRLERARRVLVPGPVDFWRGLTRLAFDSAVGGLEAALDDAIAAIRSAISSTRAALADLSDHG